MNNIVNKIKSFGYNYFYIQKVFILLLLPMAISCDPSRARVFLSNKNNYDREKLIEKKQGIVFFNTKYNYCMDGFVNIEDLNAKKSKIYKLSDSMIVDSYNFIVLPAGKYIIYDNLFSVYNYHSGQTWIDSLEILGFWGFEVHAGDIIYLGKLSSHFGKFGIFESIVTDDFEILLKNLKFDKFHNEYYNNCNIVESIKNNTIRKYPKPKQCNYDLILKDYSMFRTSQFKVVKNKEYDNNVCKAALLNVMNEYIPNDKNSLKKFGHKISRMEKSYFTPNDSDRTSVGSHVVSSLLRALL